MRSILSATGTYNYKLAKWLEEKLKPLSINEYTINDAFDFFYFFIYFTTRYLQKEKKYIYTVHYSTYTTYKDIQYTTLKHYKSCTICSYVFAFLFFP